VTEEKVAEAERKLVAAKQDAKRARTAYSAARAELEGTAMRIQAERDAARSRRVAVDSLAVEADATGDSVGGDTDT
jgi:molybdopterin biosynthesis enzyme